MARAGDFSCPQHPYWHWGPPSLLSDGYGGLSLGVNQSGHGADHTGPSDADVEKV